MRRLAPLSAAAAAAVVLTLALSACTPAADASDPAAVATPSDSASASPTPSATPTPSGDPTPSPTPTTAACLAGTWTMSQVDLVGYYDDINRLMSRSGGTFIPAGKATLALDEDGSFTWSPEIAVTGQVSGETIVVVFSGEVTGTYDQERSGRGDRIWTPNQSTEAMRVLATADGKPTDAGALSQQIGAVPITDARLSCSTDTLVLVSTFSDSTATAVLHRG